MLITIIGGTGAIGSYFAYNLAAAGNQVSIVGKEHSKNLQQISESGLTLKTDNGIYFTPNLNFTYIGAYNYSSLVTKQDLLIVSLKQTDFNLEIAKQIVNLTDEHSMIGFISNGIPFYFLKYTSLANKTHLQTIDPEGEINQILSSRNIITIIPLMGSHLESPAVVKITTPLSKIKVDVGSQFTNEESLELINQIFDKANINSNYNKNISKAILEKLQFALSINVMSALLNQTNGYVFEAKENQNYILYVIKFVNNLAQNLGIHNLRNYDTFKLANISKLHFSSMHKDMMDCKTPEVKSIISAPLELAYYFQEQGMMHLSTKPLEAAQELILTKNFDIFPSSKQIESIYAESILALKEENITSIEFNNSGLIKLADQLEMDLIL
ncbi:MAG: 2-dehydropantoate 2-reductase N-terminal domain-containing protein [Rickettsiales bacterium]